MSSIDILGVLEGDKFPPTDDRGDSVEIVALGEELGGLRGEKRVHAITKAKIAFSNDQDLRACITAIKESDERLRSRPSASIMYQWDITLRKGNTIYFGVIWYDRAFFDERKGAFLSTQHAAVFAAFHSTAKDLTVEHFVRAD